MFKISCNFSDKFASRVVIKFFKLSNLIFQNIIFIFQNFLQYQRSISKEKIGTFLTLDSWSNYLFAKRICTFLTLMTSLQCWFQEEYAAALKKGLPFPILTVAEYLSVDAEGFCWGRTYRAAGYYTCIFLWSRYRHIFQHFNAVPHYEKF